MMKINWTPSERGTCIQASELKPGISIFRNEADADPLYYLCMRKRTTDLRVEAIALVNWGMNDWEFAYFARDRQVILLGEIESFNARRI